MPDNEKLITDNLGLVHACAGKFIGRGIEYDDLFQIGCVGLIKAAKGFDSDRGLMFSTYAVPTIMGEIKRVFRDTGTIKVSRSLKELSFKVAKVREAFEKENGREPTISEIANIIGVSADEVSDAVCILQPVVSLTVESDDGVSQLELPVESDEENINNRIYVKSLLESLEENDAKLIIMRYFEGKTQMETAKIMNMSQVQVSRAEKRILARLRQTEKEGEKQCIKIF